MFDNTNNSIKNVSTITDQKLTNTTIATGGHSVKFGFDGGQSLMGAGAARIDRQRIKRIELITRNTIFSFSFKVVYMQ